MANHERLTQWVLAIAKDLNLQVTNLEWIGDYYKDYSDLAVKIEIDSKIYDGRGSDSDSTTALMKGVTEAVERFACAENRISSFGVAGHYDLDVAKENSLLEFIERSSISFHFNEKLGMKHHSSESISINTKDFGLLPFKVHQFQMTTPENTFGVFTLAEGIDSGFQIGGIMGAAVARNLKDAVKKSSIECFRNLAALKTYSRGSLSLDQFKKIKKPSAEDSQSLLFNNVYCRDLLELFLIPNPFELKSNLHLENLIFEELDYSSPVLANCPLKFVKCLDQFRNPAPHAEFVG